jgi:hypothetical protein
MICGSVSTPIGRSAGAAEDAKPAAGGTHTPATTCGDLLDLDNHSDRSSTESRGSGAYNGMILPSTTPDLLDLDLWGGALATETVAPVVPSSATLSTTPAVGTLAAAAPNAAPKESRAKSIEAGLLDVFDCVSSEAASDTVAAASNTDGSLASRPTADELNKAPDCHSSAKLFEHSALPSASLFDDLDSEQLLQLQSMVERSLQQRRKPFAEAVFEQTSAAGCGNSFSASCDRVGTAGSPPTEKNLVAGSFGELLVAFEAKSTGWDVV